MNPRESLLDNFLDEFATDQSAPLELLSSLPIHMPTNSYEMDQLRKLVQRLSKADKFIPKNQRINNTSNSKLKHSPALVPLNFSHFTKKQPILDDVTVCFKEVPEIFFHSDFSLQDPKTFDHIMSVCGGADAQVQDRLTAFLDLVELALLKLIWSKSPSFFRALDDIKGLQGCVTDATLNTMSLRSNLRSVDAVVAVTAMRIPRLQRRRQNQLAVQELLLSVKAVLQVEDYLGAIEILKSSKRSLQQLLTGVTALQIVHNQLDQYDDHIRTVMCTKFIKSALEWTEDESAVRAPTRRASGTAVSIADELLDQPMLSEGSARALAGEEAEVRQSFRVLIRVLFESERLHSALQLYKSRLIESIRLIVRTCLTEYLSGYDPTSGHFDLGDDIGGGGGGGESETPFGQRVKAMTSEMFLSCLSMIFEHILLALARCRTIHDHVTEIISTIASEAATAHSTGDTADPEARHEDRDGREGEGYGEEEGLDDTRHSARDSRQQHRFSQEGSEGSGDRDGSKRPSSKSQSQASSSSHSNGPAAENGVKADVNGSNGSDIQKGALNSFHVEIMNTSNACVTAACELAQRSIAQLLSLRKESNSRLSVDKMKFLWEISLFFILSIERTSQSSAYVLRQSLVQQSKAFLEVLSEQLKSKLINALDAEKWSQVDVSTDRQKELDRLVSGKAFLPQTGSSTAGSVDASAASSQKATDERAVGAGEEAGVGEEGDGHRKKKEVRAARVDNQSYRVVWSVMLLTEQILTYLGIAVDFSPVTSDVIAKTVELLRLFDTRTRQLVLGAQAIQSAARLKSISAKHLCVTAQSLGLLLAILPHVRAALLAQLPPKHHMLLTELDRVSQSVVEHHTQVLSKFVSIVSDFVDASAGRLKAVDWDRFQGQCEYFDEVLKNVSALHRVLSSTLPSEQVQDVFSRIFALLNRKIPVHFEEVMPSTQTGRQRILDEVVHLVSACAILKQVDASSISLEDTFRAKYGR